MVCKNESILCTLGSSNRSSCKNTYLAHESSGTGTTSLKKRSRMINDICKDARYAMIGSTAVIRDWRPWPCCPFSFIVKRAKVQSLFNTAGTKMSAEWCISAGDWFGLVKIHDAIRNAENQSCLEQLQGVTEHETGLTRVKKKDAALLMLNSRRQQADVSKKPFKSSRCDGGQWTCVFCSAPSATESRQDRTTSVEARLQQEI